MRQVPIPSFLLLLSSAGESRPSLSVTEFYVDPDYSGSVRDGAAATPWSSLGGYTSAPWAAINGALQTGDVTIYFSARRADLDANQPGTDELYLYRTSTSGYRLTLDGMSKYNANDASPSWPGYAGPSRFQITAGYPISTYGMSGAQDFVTIRGFVVRSTGGQLISYRGGSHVIIENNDLSALSSASIGAGLGFGDIPGSVDVTIRNNVIHDTFGEAIYLGGNSYTVGAPPNLDGVVIEKNVIFNAGRWGGEGDCIDLKAALINVVVRNNVCHDNVGASNVNGIVSLSPLTAEGNVIFNIPGGDGIVFGTPGVIQNNLIFNVPNVGIYSCDDETHPVGTSIVNNTIFNCGVGLLVGDFLTASSFTVKNNLIMGCPGGVSGGWLPSSGGPGSITVSYNDAYANGGSDYGYPLKAFVDGTNVSADPLFVDGSNPAGADGSFFTADDGFKLQPASPVAQAGEGGTFIGAYGVASADAQSVVNSAADSQSGTGRRRCGASGLEAALILGLILLIKRIP